MISTIVNTKTKIPFKKKDNPFKPDNVIPVINYVTHSEPILNFNLMGKQTVNQHYAYEKLIKEIDASIDRIMGIEKTFANYSFVEECRIQHKFDKWYKELLAADLIERENKLTIDSLTSLKDEIKYFNFPKAYEFITPRINFTKEV